MDKTKPSPHDRSALTLGIKTVGIGKRGSKPLEPDLINQIIEEIRSGQASPIAMGAFFGALTIKGITPEERQLENAFEPGILDDPERLVQRLAPKAPDLVKEFCVRLLQGQALSTQEAEQFGQFLFSDEPGEGARGLTASILRVRYETPDEYEGLLKAMQATMIEPFRAPVPEGEAIIQFAEPFDGVDHSNLITPLVADHFQGQNYRTVSLVGRNSGPKYMYNLRDLARSLQGKFLSGNAELSGEKPSFGWYIDQATLSPAVDKWVERRHKTVKRPFLSTLERFMNPLNASIVIASAFHPPYGEKMLTICEHAALPSIIIVRNGLEGTLAFPLLRAARILCSSRQKNGSYKRHEMILDPKDVLQKTFDRDERLDAPLLTKNTELIRDYHDKGSSGYTLFDARINATCAGLKKAIEWVEQN